MGGVSPFAVIFVLILGVLFFGKNLPWVAKQIGSALIEFRKGLDEWKEVRMDRKSGGLKSSDVGRAVQDEPEERFESLGTKFEPPSEKV